MVDYDCLSSDLEDSGSYPGSDKKVFFSRFESDFGLRSSKSVNPQINSWLCNVNISWISSIILSFNMIFIISLLDLKLIKSHSVQGLKLVKTSIAIFPKSSWLDYHFDR